MKDTSFCRNSKLFADVESVKKAIRDEIHDKCRNISRSPSMNSRDHVDSHVNRHSRSKT